MIDEKILVERLEEEINDAKNLWDDDEYYIGQANAYEHTIAIVNQLAEESNKRYEPTIDLIEHGVEGYNLHLKEQYRKGYEDAKKDNGWIPCSERLPSIEEVKEWATFLATIRVNGKYDIMDFCLFGTDGKWLVSEGKEVIAWKRQMPYQPKE